MGKLLSMVVFSANTEMGSFTLFFECISDISIFSSSVFFVILLDDISSFLSSSFFSFDFVFVLFFFFFFDLSIFLLCVLRTVFALCCLNEMCDALEKPRGPNTFLDANAVFGSITRDIIDLLTNKPLFRGQRKYLLPYIRPSCLVFTFDVCISIPNHTPGEKLVLPLKRIRPVLERVKTTLSPTSTRFEVMMTMSIKPEAFTFNQASKQFKGTSCSNTNNYLHKAHKITKKEIYFKHRPVHHQINQFIYYYL